MSVVPAARQKELTNVSYYGKKTLTSQCEPSL